MDNIFVSIVLVISDKSEIIETQLSELSKYLIKSYSDYEIVIVDQKSSTKQETLLDEFLSKYDSIRHIRLTQEVPMDVAIAAGIENAIGDFTIYIDLNYDNIEIIKSFTDSAALGNDITIATTDKINSLQYKIVRKLSKRLLNSIGYNLPENSTGSFCVSRRTINTITESGKFYCKLYIKISNCGYSITNLDCSKLIKSRPKKTIKSGIKDTLHHMIFNSTKPLRWMSLLGIFGSLMAMIFSMYSLLINIIKNQVAPGWTTTILFMSFFFTIAFMMLSFFGEYLARLLNDRSEHKEYSVQYEKCSSIMLNIERNNVLLSEQNKKTP